MNRIEARAPGFGFPKLKEGPSEALPAIGGIDSDVVDKKSFIVNGEDYYPHDGSVAFGDGYSLISDDLCVIVAHRARQHAEALDVVARSRRVGSPPFSSRPSRCVTARMSPASSRRSRGATATSWTFWPRRSSKGSPRG